MLKRLHIQNFTVFADADFEFGPGLNVLVGTNGMGKSHVLKLGYVAAQVAAFAEKTRQNKSKDELDEDDFRLNIGLATSGLLSSAFLPGTQNKLVRVNKNNLDAYVQAAFGLRGETSVGFHIKASERPLNSVSPDQANRFATVVTNPVFIPAKEILSLMPDIIGIAKNNPDVFDSTYSDLATQLTIRTPNNPSEPAKTLLATWAKLMGGTIQSEDGRFYFYPTDGTRFRVGLAAEGFRKLGTLAHLLANKSLTKSTTLFWDEPESNLNPALLRELVRTLADLARQGFQIILATHSMGLLKQFHILLRQRSEKPFPIRYFGLNAEPGQSTVVVAVDDFELLPDIVALNVELEQADDLDEIFAREDQLPNANNY